MLAPRYTRAYNRLKPLDLCDNRKTYIRTNKTCKSVCANCASAGGIGSVKQTRLFASNEYRCNVVQILINELICWAAARSRSAQLKYSIRFDLWFDMQLNTIHTHTDTDKYCSGKSSRTHSTHPQSPRCHRLHTYCRRHCERHNEMPFLAPKNEHSGRDGGGGGGSVVTRFGCGASDTQLVPAATATGPSTSLSLCAVRCPHGCRYL